MMRLQTIADCLQLTCDQDTPVMGVTLDSRQVMPGDLFVALVGESSDGHDYAKQAEERGAVAVLCSHAIGNLSIPEFVVTDPVQALGKLALMHRSTFSLPMIALTGSNGKTTVKEMIYQILPKPALATQGNLNNHLGVPLTLFKLNETHRYAVLELGANHLGEIAYTARLVKPDIALINNIAPAHVGEFGSIDNIAQAKGELYQSLSQTGTAIINDDDAYAHFWDDIIASRSQLRFSQKHQADIYAKKIVLDKVGCASFMLHTPDWCLPVRLSLPGKHHVSNALAATACCFAAGVQATEIVQGLQNFQGVRGRQTFLKGLSDALIIDDTYNANLQSVTAAIDVLAARPGKRFLVLGDMGELGPFAHEHHQSVGHLAREKKLDGLLTCGHYVAETAHSFGKGATHCQTQDELIALLKPMLDSHTTILVKGSRAAAMEHVVAALLPSTT